MSFVVSARKYRPQKFEDVYGQAHITDTLKSAIISDKLAHAFLFTGPRGVGKTTCARILAKVINAPEPKVAVKDGSYADLQIDIALNIFELDAASNNSVEHIRSLVEQVRIPPQAGKYKVFIIDEVHMLSQAAFNAFLKTLEEPPPYAIFILATTEKHKIIPTILSRCQIFDFKRIQIAEMVTQMEGIAKDENIKIDNEALHLIAEKADGAMRDALSIFDRIANSTENEITRQYVVDQLNILDYEYFFKSSDAIIKEDEASLLLTFDEVLVNGFESDHYLNGLASHFRNLLLSKDVATHKLLQVSDSLSKRYLEQGQIFSSSNIMTALHIINQADINYPKAKHKRLHVEIALLKLCYLNRIQVSTKENKTVQKSNTKLSQAPRSITASKEITAVVKTPPKILIKEEAPSLSPKVVEKGSRVENLENNKEAEVKAESVHDNSIMNTPSLGSIDSLINEIKANEKTVEAPVGKIDIERVEVIWLNFLSEATSPSTINALNRTHKSVDENILQVVVPNQLAKDILLQESELIQQIREELNSPELELKIVLDKSQFPEIESTQPKKYLSDKEKYEALVKTNPLLEEFIKKFKMKLDS